MDDQAIEKEIQAKGKTAARITPDRISQVIAGYNTFNVGAALRALNAPAMPGFDLLTMCVIQLENGFTVTGESACASPENFDQEIGNKIALDNAKQKIWALEGYLLKQQLHDAANLPPAPGAAHAGYSTLPPHQQRVVDEKADLGEKIHKLVDFFDTPIFTSLAADEQLRLQQQAVAMDQYFTILLARIAAFTPA